MILKPYVLVLFFHVIVFSGCGISKNPNNLIIDRPENSKVKKEVKDNLSHYYITFAEKNNELTIFQMPYPPSPVFISIDKSFKVELNKQLEAMGLELKVKKRKLILKALLIKLKG